MRVRDIEGIGKKYVLDLAAQKYEYVHNHVQGIVFSRDERFSLFSVYSKGLEDIEHEFKLLDTADEVLKRIGKLAPKGFIYARPKTVSLMVYEFDPNTMKKAILRDEVDLKQIPWVKDVYEEIDWEIDLYSVASVREILGLLCVEEYSENQVYLRKQPAYPSMSM